MFLCFLHDVPIIVYNNDDFPAGGDGQPDKKKEDSQLDKTHKTCNTKSYVDDDSICGASPPRASQVVCPSTVIHAGLESVPSVTDGVAVCDRLQVYLRRIDINLNALLMRSYRNIPTNLSFLHPPGNTFVPRSAGLSLVDT